MKLILKRKGTFHAHWSDITNMCGIPTQQRRGGYAKSYQYSYECVIEAGTKLDKHGFIIDQLKVDEYFQDKYETPGPALSCERIAAFAVVDVANMLKAKGMTDVYRIAVTITFNELASMTCEWVKPVPAPTAPSIPWYDDPKFPETPKTAPAPPKPKIPLDFETGPEYPLAIDFETASTVPLARADQLMTFQVGDKVTIERKVYGVSHAAWVSVMDKAIGQTGIITRITDAYASIALDTPISSVYGINWPLKSLELRSDADADINRGVWDSPSAEHPPSSGKEFKVGDWVVVTKKQRSYTKGWVASWIKDMDQAVGKVGVIVGVVGAGATVKIESITNGTPWNYPTAVLAHLDEHLEKNRGRYMPEARSGLKKSVKFWWNDPAMVEQEISKSNDRGFSDRTRTEEIRSYQRNSPEPVKEEKEKP